MYNSVSSFSFSCILWNALLTSSSWVAGGDRGTAAAAGGSTASTRGSGCAEEDELEDPLLTPELSTLRSGSPTTARLQQSYPEILIQRSAKVFFLGWVTRPLRPEASHAA